MGMTTLTNMLGINLTATYALIVMFVVSSYLLHDSIKDPKKKNEFIVYILVAFVIIFVTVTQDNRASLTPIQQDISEEGQTMWQEEYIIQARAQLNSYDVDVANTEYYDYFNETITSVARQIVLSSENPLEAVEKTMEYVFQNTEYVRGESDGACFDGTAPKILEGGKAQCDTQSIVVIAILRRMGIAARPVGGCVVANPSCNLQSIVGLQAFSDILRVPRYTELEEVDVTQDVFSRSAEAIDSSRRGGLHAWATAWIPGEGWLGIESTNGLFIDSKCYDYHVEIFPDNNQKDNICVTMNPNYALACKQNSLTLLDANGIGIFGEVAVT